MSSSTPGQSSTPSSDFKSILDTALKKYEEKTRKPLFDDPLAHTELKQCESVDAIKAIFRGQAEAVKKFRDGDRLMERISPTVDVLCTFSDTLGGVAGIAFPPAGAIFTGIGVLLAAAKNVKASHDVLVELFGRIESFFTRLGVHTQVSLTTEMKGVFVNIISEVLNILSIATKEVKRKRARIYLRNLLGNKDIVDALARLDNLIKEEDRLASAETATNAKIAINKLERITWNQIEQNVRTWFSPPEPSTNHNTACGVYNNVPPTWFFEAAIFKGWMSNGSLLWVHGKPGSGKSVLCAATIKHIMELRDAGRATLAYFYFDFQDEAKQNVANALTSLLVQLSAYSDPCCEIVHRLYLTHGRGAQRPMNDILIDCLEKMLTVAAQHPIFIIMDALDECPDVGMPTPREAVLNLLKHLVRLHLPNLHVCVTSRLEVDIKTMLKPLAVNEISLHDDSGQKRVIANYVRSVVSSDARMSKWGDEDKELVVLELSKRADGMFQWVFCQLELLRHAVQPNVRVILEELPKTLDGTYERVLKNIDATNQAHARHLLHCLAVAVRPLRVEELAEILTFDFDVARGGGIPKFRPNRRLKDQEDAVLSICSSLITIVDKGGSRVVQFSHLSVKEFLTSNHLASTGNLSTYQILPGPAHTILAQACLGLLLHLDGRNDNKSVKESPLAEYAARHWIAHAQFEGVASHVEDGVQSLYDLGKPHAATWMWLCNPYSGAKKVNDNVDEITWGKIEQNIRKWFSPPDPSTNHNTACGVYNNTPPMWLFEGSTFKRWMSNGSLLWVHGKSGSGKSVLCAAIIEHIMELRDAGRATLAYFYFDFQDEEKQNVTNALTSLLVQLSAYSESCCDIVHRLYLTHGRGTQRPSNDILIDCLEKMVAAVTQHPIFIVMDALDECPDVGSPTPREAVLNLLKDLVCLDLPNLHVCVTSRPEVDIRTMLMPLAVDAISLHEDTGQKGVIANYVRAVVSSDTCFRKWRDEDKELVVEELAKRADGMFQWVYCQFMMLRYAVQPDVRAILEELPETLDGTYERVLKNINPKNRAHATRLLHCLAVAVRPLRVEELAEILKFDFDAAQEGIPKFRPNRRLPDQEEAVLSICSSLITIVDKGGFRVVQFSHLSVKEFLTSNHLATLTGNLSTYQILPGPAHTILAQACLGLLLHLDDRNDNKSVKESPLAEYAARHWMTHAQFEGVASRVEGGVQSLYDLGKPHAATWMWLYNHYSGAKKVNDNVDEIMWNKIEQNVRKWFSPPDPSTNHNTACGVYNNTPPTWLLFEGSTFERWMSNGSLLWVHGKPGSGKSTLCAAIIQHIMTLRDAGRATLAYFYFDFGDEEKQNIRNLTTSLIIQLSAYSKPCCDLVYHLYLTHGKGLQQPSNDILIDRLKEMLTVTAHHPIFIIIDALDECPAFGIPTPRGAVLRLVKDLVRLHLPNLHVCVTSRPEIDIRAVLEPWTSHHISLHNEAGQNIDITNYVSSVVSSGVCKKWRDEDKELVIEVLSERADGMFHWAFCQLETLRHVTQSGVRVILEELPETLDETYERVLKNINENNREHARRLLHCLAVAVRPLHVEELAGILAFDFDDVAWGGIPEFHADWWPEDQEDAVLSICSSLVTIVDNQGSRVVQFSHLSVKEFLTSNRLATSNGLSTYYIDPGYAHTVLAQACLGLLLHLDDRNDNKSIKDYPLAEYAARHWVLHAQFEGVAPRVEDGLRSLFDADKPHFATWTRLYDIDAESGGRLPSAKPSILYYSALCGFHDLVRYLLFKHPQDVNAIGGSFEFPLFAAIYRNHFRAAGLLLQHGGNPDVRDTRKQTALHKAIDRRDGVFIEAVQLLLSYGADVNAWRDDLWTPLHLAVNNEELWVAMILLRFGADVNSQNGDGQAPLHLLSRRETSQGKDDGSDIARLLLEHGANVDENDKDNATPLHLACYNQKLEIVRLLLEHGANADAEKDRGETPLQLALSRRGHHDAQDGVGIVRLLLGHGAEAYGRDTHHISTSDLTRCFGNEKIGQVLLVDGGKFKAEKNRDQTAFWLWIEECSVGGKVQDKYDTILLHSASYHGRPDMVRTLLENGVKSNAKSHRGETALHVVSRARDDSQDSARVGRLSLERGVDGSTEDTDHDAEEAGVAVARLLLEHSADVNAKTWSGQTPLDLASNRRPKLAQLLHEHCESETKQLEAVYSRGNNSNG